MRHHHPFWIAVISANFVGLVLCDLHVLYCDILEDLAVVNIPDRLVVPDLRS